MKKVIVGRFPPPIGGVSVFVKRKYASLKDGGAERVDLGESLWPIKLLFLRLRGHRIFYLNTGNIYFLLFCFLFGVLRFSYIYDHNASRINWGHRRREVLYVFLVKRALGVRVVHEHLRTGYVDRGLGGIVSVESPFLPPDESERNGVYANYNDELIRFIEGGGYFKMALSASKYAVDSQGRDVYGLDSLIELLEFLSKKECSFRCLLAVAEYNEELIPTDLKDRMAQLQCNGFLIMLCEQVDFWPIYQSLDAFLRLTSTDGESVSVLEALYFNCKVVASDVVPRPAGVIRYKYGDQTALNHTVLDLVAAR